MTTPRDPGRRVLRALTRFAGGGSRPFAEAAELVVERGSGSYLYGSGGARYLDTVAGFGVASLGHSHPRWVEAVVEQAARLAVAPLDNDQLERYHAALGQVLPAGLERLALFSGGAEAVEAAVRLAQTYTGRPGIVAFGGGFHGKTAALRYSRDPSSPEARWLAPPWLHTAAYPECEHHDAVDYPTCDEPPTALRALAEHPDADDVAAVLVEPIQGTAGNVVPVRRFLPELRALCDARGWLLVLDESITGCGRTGRMFASEHFGVLPDVMILSKGLAGGFPMSAVCASEHLWRGSPIGGPSGTTTAFGANPLACAAGVATLEVITGDGFLESVRAVAGHAAERLRRLAVASSRVARPRGLGLMLGFDLIDPDSGQLASEATCRAMMRACRERGVLTAAHVPRIRINPPLTVSRAEIDELFDVFHEVLV